MRKFAEVWADKEIVQQVVAQIQWRSIITLMDKLDNAESRIWYAKKTLKDGWSSNVLYNEHGVPARQGSEAPRDRRSRCQMIDMIRDNPSITTVNLAEVIGIHERSVKRNMKLLQDAGIVARVGSSRKGYWVISTDESRK
jgi:predicted HTH transcriptional regulator